MADLKPCPFCGTDADLYPPTAKAHDPKEKGGRFYPIVRCKMFLGGCGAEALGKDHDQSGKSAVEAWNRRAHPAPIQAEQSLEVVAWNLECQTLGGDTGWKLSWSRSGAGLCNRLSGVEHEVALTDHAKATAALAQKDAEIALLVAERNLAWAMCDQLRAQLNKEAP